MKFEIGNRYYYHVEFTGTFNSAILLRTTNKFCILLTDSGDTKRKAKHLLYLSADDAKISVIQKIDKSIREQYYMNILELSVVFKEMLVKYPEKFI